MAAASRGGGQGKRPKAAVPARAIGRAGTRTPARTPARTPVRKPRADVGEGEYPGNARDFSAALEEARLRQVAIERAKLEWEGTVDALAVMVCLVGREGQVMRANRVVEDWGLGNVSRTVGQHAHTLLHRRCRRPNCPLKGFIAHALHSIRNGARTQFEVQERIGRRYLQITLRPLRTQILEVVEAGVPLAVLVATDLSALHHAREALERLNVSLEARVRVRTQALADANRDLRSEIARREQAEVNLRRSRNELAALSEQLIRAQEGERKRIAVELHDSVGQSLSAVKYTLERGLELFRQPQRGDPEPVLQLAVKRLQESAESIRAISMNLRPKILDDLGAASAVQWFCRDFAETYPHIRVTADLEISDREVPPALATVVYRCVQELLNNVAKHAGAKEVRVSLSSAEGTLHLQVRDDGIGVDKASADSRSRGSGLRNLRERAQLSGGQFSITRAPGRGTLAQFSWPVIPQAGRERPG